MGTEDGHIILYNVQEHENSGRVGPCNLSINIDSRSPIRVMSENDDVATSMIHQQFLFVLDKRVNVYSGHHLHRRPIDQLLALRDLGKLIVRCGERP